MEQKTLGGFLAALRKESGMTQKELAERLNVSDKTISRWERDDGSPDLAALPLLAEIFGVSCDELLRGQRNEPVEAAEAPPTAALEKKPSRLWPIATAALAAVLAISLLIQLFSGAAGKKSLYDQGAELISVIEEMAASQSYVSIYSATPDLQDHLARAAQGDRSTPKAVYEISVPKGVIAAMTELSGVEGLSDSLKSHVAARTHGGLASQINAANGASVLAASSICTAGKTFVNRSLEENTIYLYTYEDALPAMVTFTPGEDHAVSASACFIFNEEFVTDYIEAVEVFFAEIGAEVTLVYP